MRPINGLPQRPRCKDNATLRERLEANHEKLPNGCWNWLGAKTHTKTNGYGRIMINYRVRPAHRISFLVFKGPLDPDVCVLHKCDNPSCINPDHLFDGTKQDNVDDMIAKGRFKYAKNRVGTNNPQAVLTPEQVLEIMTLAKSGLRPTAISKRLPFKASVGLISAIVTGKTWAHLHILADFTPIKEGRWSKGYVPRWPTKNTSKTKSLVKKRMVRELGPGLGASGMALPQGGKAVIDLEAEEDETFDEAEES